MKRAIWCIVLCAGLMAGRWSVTVGQEAEEEDGMVLIPAGEFTMGSKSRDGLSNEQPAHKVTLAAFKIDKTEVTNAQYAEFLKVADEHKTCHPAEPKDWDHTPQYREDASFNKPDLPVVGVSWWDAYAYAKWAGKRLPTEAEWEKAARGDDGRLWPWGDEKPEAGDKYRCNFSPYPEADSDGYKYTAPVTSFPEGASPCGALNMAGNVWEWCADWFGEKYYASSPAASPTGPDEGSSRVTRGGSWWSNASACRCAFRQGRDPDTKANYLGFRCAKSVEP